MAIPMQQSQGTFPRLLYLYLTHLKQKEAEQLLPGVPCVLSKVPRQLRLGWLRGVSRTVPHAVSYWDTQCPAPGTEGW